MRNSLVPELETDREVQKLYEEEGLVLEVTEAICELLQKQNVKRVELAKRLCVDKSYITQLLDGSSNMTLKTISDVLFCLDSRAKIQIESLQMVVEDFSDFSDDLLSAAEDSQVGYISCGGKQIVFSHIEDEPEHRMIG